MQNEMSAKGNICKREYLQREYLQNGISAKGNICKREYLQKGISAKGQKGISPVKRVLPLCTSANT